MNEVLLAVPTFDRFTHMSSISKNTPEGVVRAPASPGVCNRRGTGAKHQAKALVKASSALESI